MGMSVFSECDAKQYFSVSTIRRDVMDDYGLTCTIKELRVRAKNSIPAAEIITGQSRDVGHRKMTKIYRYSDFKEVKNGDDQGYAEGNND